MTTTPSSARMSPDRAGDIGGGYVAVVEALVVAALLDVADAAANFGELLPEVQSHRIGSGAATLKVEALVSMAGGASAGRASGFAVSICNACCLRPLFRFFRREPLGPAGLSVRLPSVQRSLQ